MHLTKTTAKPQINIRCIRGHSPVLAEGKIYQIAVVVLKGFDHTYQHKKDYPYTHETEGVILAPQGENKFPYMWAFNRFEIVD